MNEASPPWHFDRAAALDRLDHDPDLLANMIRQFLEEAPVTLAAIDAAVNAGDGAAIGDAAHALKTAAGYLAADALCLRAQTIEGFGRVGQIDDARAAWPALAASAAGVIAALERVAEDEE